MKARQKSVGSFDAKTNLARMIDEVQKGIEFIITKRGRPVARLIKYRDMNDIIEMNEIIAQFDSIRNTVKGKIDIKGYISEGRKH